MRHVFKATKLGWDSKKEAIWFDADKYSEAEARAQFKPYQGVTQKGYSYTGYEYDGQKYYDVQYLGVFKKNEMPKDDFGYVSALLKKLKGNK